MTGKFPRKLVFAYWGVALVGVLGGWLWGASQTPSRDLVALARAYLGSLDASQRAKAVMPYDTPQRAQWHYVPLAQRRGLALGAMSAPQRDLAERLLRGTLSEAGYEKATTIMELEKILQALQQGEPAWFRDPGRYFFTLYGEPGEQNRWQMSVEGHHLSLNFVIDHGTMISHTPSFLGANPAEVKSDGAVGPKKGTRPLAKEEQLAFELLHALSSAQAKEATIAERAPRDIRGGGEPQAPKGAPEGLALAQMDAKQKEILLALIGVYVENLPSERADRQWREIREAGTDKICFAWAGASQPGIGHYYRIQGPTFLIELCNTQPDAAGNPANHVHTVFRSLRGDFAMAP